MHAGPKAAIDGFTRRQPYSPHAHWIDYPLTIPLFHRDWLTAMLRGLLLALLLHLGLTALPASADGKYYAAADRIPPYLPYQRALIAFDGEREILVVQSKFQGAGDEPLGDIGWVVPVPALPQVGTLSPADADALFTKLQRTTRIEKVSVADWLRGVLILLVALALAHSLMALIRLLSSGTRNGKMAWLSLALVTVLGLLPAVRQPLAPFFFVGLLVISVVFSSVALFKFIRGGAWKRRASYGVRTQASLVLGGLLFLLFGTIPQFSEYTGKDGVEVIKKDVVGKLEIKVIRARTASELTDWLQAQRFGFDQEDVAAFASYVAQGWVFVTARPVAGAQRAEVIGQRGMLAPLVLVFPTKQAIYPLALTATAARELQTRIDLYVFSQSKMDAGGRMQMSYAAADRQDPLLLLADRVEPKHALDRATLKEGFLTRFYGQLDEQQMRSDLVLLPAADNAPYTWEIVW
jgi:hypothetical protein